MPQNEKNIWKLYYRNVLSDYQEVKDRYPLACLTIPPMVRPALATIRVIAANSALIYAVEGTEKDFLGKYSRELHLLVPIEYRKQGCKVYGAKWVKIVTCIWLIKITYLSQIDLDIVAIWDFQKPFLSIFPLSLSSPKVD